MKIFISYRRIDSGDIAGRVADRLAATYGPNAIFKDIESIQTGMDFRLALKTELQESTAVIVLIGENWLNIKDSSGQRRIDNPMDSVRIEIETALKLKVPVVPVLLEGAIMPSASSLPLPIRDLAYRNALLIRRDPDFHYDIERLLGNLGILHEEKLNEIEPQKEITTVFISHSTSDRKWVEKHVIDWLEKNSIQTWYSKISISTASQWEREILKGLEVCEWFLLVVSPRSSKSEWVKDELNWAI